MSVLYENFWNNQEILQVDLNIYFYNFLISFFFKKSIGRLIHDVDK